MISYKNLHVLGTSHISIESINQVESSITDLKPDIVALELDAPRFNSLMYKKKAKFSIKDVGSIGFKGYLFNKLGAYIEKKLGKLTGTSPGDEMKAGARLAWKNKINIALIDQDIRITLRNISKRLTFREKLRFLTELLFSAFSPNKIKFDLRKVPSKQTIHKLTSQLKRRYPSLYTSLILDRNIIMAKRLYTLMATNKKILAIVGAGHEDDIIKLIKQEKGDPKFKLVLLKPK